MGKVLIVAAKLYNDPTGGGGTVVKHLIDTFVDDFEIDLVLYRTPTQAIFTHKNLTTHFHPISHRTDNKFERRIMNVGYNLDYLVNNFGLKSYLKIIIIHASKVFGFENLEQEILNKTVLFPMFLTPSYLRSNENVPKEYTLLEKSALNAIAQIITPSQSEKDDIIDYYGIDERKITLIQRGIDEVFIGKPKTNINKPIKMIAVSSIKPQKNVIESIQILKQILDHHIEAHLTIIGRIESKELINDIYEYTHKHHLDHKVKIIEGAPLSVVADEMKKADIFILTSLWETFGRVVYEGFATGLPAIIRGGIECFSELSNKPFVLTYYSVEEVVDFIINLTSSVYTYSHLSVEAIDFAKKYQSNLEKNRLREAIIWQG